jgi:hypothetical protein
MGAVTRSCFKVSSSSTSFGFQRRVSGSSSRSLEYKSFAFEEYKSIHNLQNPISLRNFLRSDLFLVITCLLCQIPSPG